MVAASGREPPLWETRGDKWCLWVHPPPPATPLQGRSQQVRGLEHPCLCFPAFGPLGPLAWERGSEGRPDGCALVAQSMALGCCVSTERATPCCRVRGLGQVGLCFWGCGASRVGSGRGGGGCDPVPSLEVGPCPGGQLLAAAAAARVPETAGGSLPSLPVGAST